MFYFSAISIPSHSGGGGRGTTHPALPFPFPYFKLHHYFPRPTFLAACSTSIIWYSFIQKLINCPPSVLFTVYPFLRAFLQYLKSQDLNIRMFEFKKDSWVLCSLRYFIFETACLLPLYLDILGSLFFSLQIITAVENSEAHLIFFFNLISAFPPPFFFDIWSVFRVMPDAQELK